MALNEVDAVAIAVDAGTQALVVEEKRVMTPRTCRTARTLIEMEQIELADRSGVSVQTIRNYESGREPTLKTWRAIKYALESAGVVFFDEDNEYGEGVRLRKPRGVVTPSGGA
jgi:DNA-binding transcriptional regulator YiaG